MNPKDEKRLESINDELFGELSLEEQQFLVGGTLIPTPSTTTHNKTPDTGYDEIFD